MQLPLCQTARLAWPTPVLCHTQNLGLTEGQGVGGAKRGGLRMGTSIDDERQCLQPLGPRQQGWPQTPHLRRRSGSMGLQTRFSPLAPCRWGVCDQSILIFGCDRALANWSIITTRNRVFVHSRRHIFCVIPISDKSLLRPLDAKTILAGKIVSQRSRERVQKRKTKRHGKR